MVEQDGPDLRFSADAYALIFPSDRPFVYLADRAGRLLAELFILSSVHTLAGLDDSVTMDPWQVAESAAETVFSTRVSSSLWDAKTIEFRCLPHRLTYQITVEGQGMLSEALYFGGYSSAHPRWGSGFFASGNTFLRGFNPEPNTRNQPYFDPAGGTLIDLSGAPLPGKRHWFFTPAPFCLAFETHTGWVGLGVEAEPGENRFTEYRYHAGPGFSLSLAYDGMTQVRGEYRLPAIGIDFAGDEYAVLAAHVTALRIAGKSPSPDAFRPDWWSRPIFCGWGAQCARAAADHGYGVQEHDRPDFRAFLATMRYAAGYARQNLYQEWLASLAGAGVLPGTVVVDDKGQRTYGDNVVDEEKWPDLPGFVQRHHDEGRHVLLWLKAWDREGVPDEECILNVAGVPLAVDPTNPHFERRLRASVRRMLSADGYGADGFKIDFTHRIPNGPGLRLQGDSWGLELLRLYLSIIHDEARAIKADALIMGHTPHPYLTDVVDMIRLNDMLDLTELDDPTAGWDIASAMQLRAHVARVACPDTPIDTDNWPVRNKAVWREYVELQPRIGIPSLYFATHIDLTQEPLEAEDYDLIRETWQCYDRTERDGAR